MNKTILVKRSIAEYGNPKKNRESYYVYFEPTLNGTSCNFDRGKWYLPPDKGVEVFPTHWYEELPLSKLIEELMPTEEEINLWLDRNCIGISEGIIMNASMGEWLKKKLTTVKA